MIKANNLVSICGFAVILILTYFCTGIKLILSILLFIVIVQTVDAVKGWFKLRN